MVEQMAPSYSEKENQNSFQGSDTHQAMVKTAYESISSSYIMQLGCVIVLLVLCVCFYRLKQNARLGPRYWPFLGSVCDISAHYCHLHDWLLGFFLSSKTIHVRMPWGRVYYCTVDPVNVQYLLQTNSVNFRKGKGFFKRMEVLLGQKELHESWVMRNWVASEFCKPSVCDLTAAVMKKKTCTIARLLAEVAGEGTTVDIQDLIQRATLDAIGKVAFGVDFASLPSALPKPWPHIAFASSLDLATTIAVKRFSDPFWELKRYMNIGPERMLPEQMQVVDGFTFSLIADRKAELKHLHGQVYDLAQAYLAHAEGTPYANDLVSKFLNLTMRDDQADNHQTDELLRHIVINFVIASRDAIGVTLTWLVYELSMHSDASHRLYLELRDYESRRQFECECSVEQYWDVELQDEDYVRMMDTRIREFAALITSESLDELPFLHACLQETLRLHPAVPLDPRDIEEDDTLPAGEVFVSSKKGNVVFIAPYSMARMTSIWGPDAVQFNPDRWLQSGKLEPASDSKFVTFQAGLYTGAVKDLTYQSCKVTAAILVRFFEFIRACPVNRPPEYRMTSTLVMESGLQMYPRLKDKLGATI
ncbi:protein MpCYP704-like7 [Marchantia polymorpha subsp. ruderalis]